MAASVSPSGSSLRWLAVNVLLIVALLVSAVAVVGTSHECRLSYARLQKLQSAEWDMQENWSRLLLQESALATHYRVAQAASGRLQMRVPAAADTRLVLR